MKTVRKILKKHMRHGNPHSRQDFINNIELYVFLPHVLGAMEEYASERTKELEKENSILKELNGGKLLAYDQMKEMLEQYAIQKSELEAREADWLIRCSKVEAENARLREALGSSLDALYDAENQIIYLHDKFTATGSGNSVLQRMRVIIKRIESALSSVEENKQNQNGITK